MIATSLAQPRLAGDESTFFSSASRLDDQLEPKRRFVCFFFYDSKLGNKLRLASALGRLRDN